MDSETTPSATRSEVLRAHLVATADAHGSNSVSQTRRWMTRKSAALALGVFALSGALTGGAVSAAAINAAGSRPETVNTGPILISADLLKEQMIGTYTPTYGDPILYSGQGEAIVQLGAMPEGATHLAYIFDCIDVGEFTTLLDGVEDVTNVCTEDNLESSSGASLMYVEGNDPHTLEVRSDNSGRFVVYAQWASQPEEPSQSAAQIAALADGEVTREEYEAGFQRYVDCMAADGYEVSSIEMGEQRIDYAILGDSVLDGTDDRCYGAEYKELDIEWQTEHEDNADVERTLRQCFADAGIPMEGTFEDIWMRFQNGDMELTVEDCFY